MTHLLPLCRSKALHTRRPQVPRRASVDPSSQPSSFTATPWARRRPAARARRKARIVRGRACREGGDGEQPTWDGLAAGRRPPRRGDGTTAGSRLELSQTRGVCAVSCPLAAPGSRSEDTIVTGAPERRPLELAWPVLPPHCSPRDPRVGEVGTPVQGEGSWISLTCWRGCFQTGSACDEAAGGWGKPPHIPPQQGLCTGRRPLAPSKHH